MSSSSGFKRGLAGSAIAALAITGLPFASSASAAPAPPSPNGTVQLLSQFNDGAQASARQDGANTTITLAASAAADATVVFEYNTGNPNQWVAIDAVQVRDDGYVVAQWNPAALLGAAGQATVDLRARVGDQTSTKTGVTVYGSASTAQNTVNLADDATPGDEDAGFFGQPYADSNQTAQNVIVDGTTSATTGSVELSWFDEDANTFDGQTAAPVTGGSFEGVVDISGFDLSGTPDQIAFGAERDTDDVEDYTLYEQDITEVVATGPVQPVPVGQNGTITIAVTDQNDAPIAGAEVRRDGGALVGYTDINGEVTDSRPSGTTTGYYANTTDADAFNPGVDVESNDVTLGAINPVVADADAIFADGNVFEDDEYTAGDIYVQVEDQQGNPVGAGQVVEYRLTAPMANGNVGTPAGAFSTATTDAQGRANIPFAASAADGTYSLEYRVPADRNGNNAVPVQVETFKAGQSSLVLAPEAGEGDAGGEISYTGTLALDVDGTPLPGRLINLGYERGAEQAPGDGTADAGIVDDQGGAIVLSDTRTTGDNGQFSVTVRDVAPTAPAEQGTERGTLTAATGNNVAGTPNEDGVALDGNANESDTATARFDAAGSVGTIAIDAIGDGARPGEVVPVTARVTNTQNPGGPVAGTPVTFTTENGFFTPDEENDSTTVENTYTNSGQTVTVTTGDDGTATAYLTIGRDEGFDDDGIVENTVTAESRMGTDAEEFGFDSSNPLAGGEVQLVRSPDALQDSTNENGAQSGFDAVYFDLFTLDQFGNRTDDIDEVDVTTDSDEVNVSEEFDSAFELDGDIELFVPDEDADADATVTAEWMVDGDDIDTELEGADEETFTDEATAAFYAIDYADGNYNLENTGGANQPVGSNVTVTYTALDQFGEPIQDLFVEFFRSGPSDQGGDGNAIDDTNENGVARYVFQGTAAGDAVVNAVAYEDAEFFGELTNPIPESERTVTITFGSTPPPPVRVQLNGVNNGARADVLRVNGNAAAANSTVELIKFTRNGKRVIASKVTNDAGDARFRVRDTNGKSNTTYRARLVQDEGNTLSNRRKVR